MIFVYLMSKYINGRTTELTNNSNAVSCEWLANESLY